MTEETKAAIERLIHKHYPRSRNMVLMPEHVLKEGLFGNDLDLISVIMDFEDEFGIDVTDDEDMSVKTVGDLYALVDSKLGAGA